MKNTTSAMKSYTATPVLITPEMAKNILKRNYKKNRKLNKTRIAKYARDMEKGQWNSSPLEPIGFDEEGRLIQGQHRMMAVIKSGKTVLFYVMNDVPNKDYRVLDSGKARTAGDVLKIPNAAKLATLAGNIICVEHGNSTLKECILRRFNYRGQEINPSKGECIKYVEEHTQRLQKYKAAGDHTRRMLKVKLNQTMVPFFYYLLDFLGIERLPIQNALDEEFPSNKAVCKFKDYWLQKSSNALVGYSKPSVNDSLLTLFWVVENFNRDKKFGVITKEKLEAIENKYNDLLQKKREEKVLKEAEVKLFG